MRPLIGITSALRLRMEEGSSQDEHYLRTAYTEAIIAAGGAPIILPLATDEITEAAVSHFDGLILSGGSDIPCEVLGVPPHPSCDYMPLARWHSESLWLRTAMARNVPVLGICLGMQVINVALGGTLIQDLPTERPDAQPHEGPGIGRQHEVLLEEGSWMAAAAGCLKATVTSAHHQAVADVAAGCRVTGRASDGIVEAIEYDGETFVAGVQWHPERCLDQPNWLLEAWVGLAAGAGSD